MENQITISKLFEKADSFYYGIAGNKDIERAFKVFQEIIEVGKSESGEAIYPNIFNDLVYHKYDEGSEGNKDYELASKLYKLAAKNGSYNALNNIGHLFLNGFGVAQDFNKAEEYWISAANKGDVKSQMNLVNLYKSDQYDMKNYSKAIYYCKLAVKQGDDRAIKLLTTLEGRANNTTKSGDKNSKSFWSKLKSKMKG